ncbi:ABC transporter permease [Bifidobacterium oedipodis]|uniref:Sugar ABC transporter permease n=1 Tax=Bifidobacterium oedipodis TaxID=2675322 RepID=A0A7Y0EQJ1_9BIFI|nr:ABC transporter permease subunit [Bifidobacterium sp. DSM 109957]NMM94580.1 sugar ABC transporter permease [Bifidobacterium sp. DSM 109957]
MARSQAVEVNSTQSNDSAEVVDNVAARRRMPWYLKFADHIRKYWQLWTFVLPAIIFVVIFAYVPMYGLQLAFRDFDPRAGLTGGKFVGLKYFEQFFASPLAMQVIRNTVNIALQTAIFGFLAPILLALLINQLHNTKIKSFVQTITYMPHFISVVVVVSMINIFLSPGSGILGRFFGEQSLLGKPEWFSTIYWISEVWQHCGWDCIIYLAALSAVDTALYEAAKIDGAGRLQLIRYVDLPTILPTCTIMLILKMGSILSVGFEKTFLMQNALNATSSEVLSTYVYKMGILNGQISLSTAVGLFNTLVNFGFLVLTNFITKKINDTSIF